MAGQISKITQIGMVTADLDKMVKYYEEMLGVGPWTSGYKHESKWKKS